MSRKNNLLGYNWLTGDAVSDLVSEVTQIQFLDNIGIQTDLDGADIEGTLEAQVSANFARDNQGNVTNPGTWVTLLEQEVAAGEPVTTYMDLNQLSAPWIRLIWTSTAAAEQEITTVADVDGSLNDTWFSIYNAAGTQFVFWFNVNSEGTAPTVPGATICEIAIATDATDAQVATAAELVIEAQTGLASAAVGAVITVTTLAGGITPAVDGDEPTGFDFEITSGGGPVTSIVTAKML